MARKSKQQQRRQRKKKREKERIAQQQQAKSPETQTVQAAKQEKPKPAPRMPQEGNFFTRHFDNLRENHFLFLATWGWAVVVLAFSVAQQYALAGVLNMHSLIALLAGVASLLAMPYLWGRYTLALVVWAPLSALLGTMFIQSFQDPAINSALILVYLVCSLASLAYTIFWEMLQLKTSIA